MNDEHRARLDALDQKLKAKEAERQSANARSGAETKIGSMHLAYRMVIEMIAGILVGAAMGFGLDYWLNTRPIFLVIFCLLGFAAGVRMMMESARRYQETLQEDEAKNG